MPLGDLVQCDFCDEALNLSFCNQCSVRLCVQCKEKHESLVDCKEEVVAYSSRLYPNVKWCKFHKNEEESIALCKTCTVPLCSTCLEMHEDHDLHFKQLKEERSARRSTYKDPTFQSLNKCKENFTKVQQKKLYSNCIACKQPTDPSSQIYCSRQCPAGKQPGPGVKSPRERSARRSTYKDPTFLSLNMCKEKSHVPQTNREEHLTSATCLEKLNYWLHVLKQSVEKLNALYHNERICSPQQPKEQKHQQTGTKFQTKKSSRPMSAVSEEIIHLRKNVEILEKITQLSSYEDPAEDVHLWERLKTFKTELILEDQIIDELKIMKNTEKQLTETWNKEVESLQTENEQLNHELRNYGNQIDALQRRNQELVSEITRKNEEMAEYNAEKKRLEQKALSKDDIISNLTQANDDLCEDLKLKVQECSRLKQYATQLHKSFHQPLHQQCEKGKKKNEPEIQRLQNLIDKLSTQEKMLRYEVDTLKKESQKAWNGKKDCKAVIKNLEKLCGEQRVEINLKTEELRQLNAQIKKMKSGLTKQATVTVEVRKKKQSEAIINTKTEEKMRGEISFFKDKRSAMENENERQKKELEIVYKQLLEKERELKRCINEYQELKANVNQKLQDKDNKIASLKHEIDRLQEENVFRNKIEEEKQVLHNESVSFQTELKLAKAKLHEDADKMKFVLDEKLIYEQRYLRAEKEGKEKEEEIRDLQMKLKRAEDLTKECQNLRGNNQNMEIKILRMTKAIQEKEKELESKAEQLASSEEKVTSMSNEITRIQQTKQHDAEDSARRLLKENNALKLDLQKVNSEAQQKISVLNNVIKDLQRSQGYDSEEKIKKLNRENISLKSELERITARLSSVAGEKLRDNKPDIADLSDENRPINLGEKFSQLYNDQWTDAMENLDENLGVGETEGIQCLLSILKRVFDECVRVSDDQFTQLKEITGTTDAPNDQLKNLKNLRKSTALQSVKSVKQLVNKVMSSVFSKEKDACQSYIDRCTELCWLMCVQDPPVVIDFTAVRGQVIDDKMLRKFAKTGSKIDFLVWPMIRLHKNGPLLQKGVVQPL